LPILITKYLSNYVSWLFTVGQILTDRVICILVFSATAACSAASPLDRSAINCGTVEYCFKFAFCLISASLAKCRSSSTAIVARWLLVKSRLLAVELRSESDRSSALYIDYFLAWKVSFTEIKKPQVFNAHGFILFILPLFSPTINSDGM
jgi:hypothetical protein